MSTVDVWLDDDALGGGTRIGRLTKESARHGDVVSFEYDADWLAGRGGVQPFQLDPSLPLSQGRQFAPDGAEHLSAAFVDSSPDRWGKRLMERREAIEAREAGRPIRILRDWDFLVGVDDESRMGALRLMDPESARYIDDRALSAPPYTALRELEAVAEMVERDQEFDGLSQERLRWFLQLVAPGASLGGARPKAGFRDVDGGLWLAKFPSREDRVDTGLWEFLTHRLALSAGIDMPEAQVLALSSRGHTFAVRRFDRTKRSRRAYASAMTLLAATESEGHSYLDLAQVIEHQGTPGRIAEDLEQLFRRALFNALIGNRDDHLRNHGFLREGDGWRLSPAFDVNPNIEKREHVLFLDEEDASPDSALLIGTADYYRLQKTKVASIVDEVRMAVRAWEAEARKLGLRRPEIEQMRSVIDPDR